MASDTGMNNSGHSVKITQEGCLKEHLSSYTKQKLEVEMEPYSMKEKLVISFAPATIIINKLKMRKGFMLFPSPHCRLL